MTIGSFNDISAPLTAQGIGGAFSEMASTGHGLDMDMGMDNAWTKDI